MNTQLQTNWMPPSELDRHLEIGDLIEFDRSHTRITYYHWAVFIGLEDGIKKVIHFSTENGDFGELGAKTEFQSKLINGSSSAHVRCDPYVSVVGGSIRARINNSLDQKYAPFPPVIICDRALRKLGSAGYNLIFNNCEQFAKWIRYGRHESDQASRVTSIVASTMTLAFTGSIVTATGVGTFVLSTVYVGRKFMHRFFPTTGIV